jgi:hypothetical protein
MMPVRMQPLDEMSAADAPAGVAAVLQRGRPLVLRGVVADWPAVRHAAQGTQALLGYLQRFDNGSPVDAILTPPGAQGRIGYEAGMTGFNFVRNRLPLRDVAEQVVRYAQFASAPAVAVQSALIPAFLPGFDLENRIDWLPHPVAPRLWFGNRVTTPTHVDEWHNLACVVAGRRRFTLFPPEQVENLYVGPLDFAPTGAPMSLVSLQAPDLVRFPKFGRALETAMTAELLPGDAIYIPPLWWHHVESLGDLNVLVNYWWHEIAGEGRDADAGFDALLHAILGIRGLSPATRAAWAALFDQYVFGAGPATTEHIPASRRGILGDLSGEDARRLRAHLRSRLKN